MYVFVYGTLRRDYKGSMAKYLADKANYIGQATTKGKMFDCGYPGVVHGEDDIVGDLYHVYDDQVLAALDSYEGHPHLFKRIKVTLTKGTEYIPEHFYPAWMYLYQGETDRLTHIESGDYLEHLRNKSRSNSVGSSTG